MYSKFMMHVQKIIKFCSPLYGVPFTELQRPAPERQMGSSMLWQQTQFKLRPLVILVLQVTVIHTVISAVP